MPTLITSYFLSTAQSSNTTALVTPSFTPANGEVLVAKMVTWDTGVAMNLPSGGSQTYTSRVVSAPGGFRQWEGIATAVVSGSPGAMTVSAAPAATCRHSMVVERWSSAQLAGTPATRSANATGQSLPNTTLVTVADNSVVSWASGDAQGRSPATRAYLSSAVEEGILDGSAGANGCDYYCYQAAATAGTQTIGMSAPANQQWNLVAIEIQDASVAADPVVRRQIVGPSAAAHRGVW